MARPRPLIVSCLFLALATVLFAFFVQADELPPRLPGRISKRLLELTDHEALWRDTERIAIVRTPDTPGHAAVRDYIVSQFDPVSGGLTQQWNVEIDEFESNTPMGRKTFRNIIVTWNCDAPQRVVLAAHYDSKYFPEPRNFVGATDSAAPCALLLDIARTLDSHLSCPTATNLGLQLVFFDGEEAFAYWSATDSIYGARHLATKWNNENKLSSISLFVLLDLIGAADAKFPSFFSNTDAYYGRLRTIENSLKRYLNGTRNYFQSRGVAYGMVEDDHIPFLRQGVKILHLISYPFPRVWHTDNDNLDAIHLPSLGDISAILRVFVGELMGVNSQVASSGDAAEAKRRDEGGLPFAEGGKRE